MRKVLLLWVVLSFLAIGSDLIVAVSTEPPSLDPTTNAAAVIRLLLLYNLYEPLVRLNESGQVEPLLARSWEISEDGHIYTFFLREGVRFHSGEPCDAFAVKRSFLRALDPAQGHVHPEYFQGIERIEVVDPLTVRFILKKPDASFLSLLALGESVIVPNRNDLGTNPVGTGPFQFASWDRGYQLRLVRNQDYWDPSLPKLSGVTFRFIPDPVAQLAALRAGDVDLLVEVTPEIALDLLEDQRFSVLAIPQELVQIVAINKNRVPFQDLRVRQALAHAVDRAQIIDLVSLGFASPVGSHIAPCAPYYADMTWIYPHDPEKARALLAEAGYPQGFSTTITLPANYTFHVRTGEVLAAQLAEVGIRTELRLVDWPTWLELVYSQADFDLTVIGHVGRVDPALTLIFYGSDRKDYYFRRGWEDPELNELLRLGASISAPKARQSIYTVAQYIIAREVVNIFIQAPHRLLVVRQGISGLKSLSLYVLDLTEVAKE